MYLPRMRFRYGYKFGCPIKIFEMFMSFYWYQFNLNMYEICFTFDDSQFLHFSIQIKYKLFLILYCVVSFSVEMISCLSGLEFTLNINKILWSNSICLITEKWFNGLFDEKYILSNRWNLKETDIISQSSIRCLLPIWHLSRTKFNTFDVLPFWHFLYSKQSNGI